MSKPPRFSERLPLGAVLAGGRSRRMGRDKATLTLGGRPLAERAARTLETLLDEVVVVGGTVEAAAGFPRLVDRRPGHGPLAGLETALAHAGGRPVFVLACDLPHAGDDLVRFVIAHAALAAADATVARAWYPVVGAERQPLCALYSPGNLPAVTAYLDRGGRSVTGYLQGIEAAGVEVGQEEPFYRPDLLANLNRPQDLAEVGGA